MIAPPLAPPEAAPASPAIPAAPPTHPPSAAAPLWIGPAFGPAAAREYRLRAVFECGKLDPQVADTPVLAPFPLMLAASAWREVARTVEALAAEALAAERELLARPDLHRGLALPRAVRRALAACTPACADAGPRLSRLDFHWARQDAGSQGGCWRISETNADVPGGLIEAGPLAALMLEMAGPGLASAQLAPDPAVQLARAIANRLGQRSSAPGVVALVHATAYADDFQVMRRAETCVAAAGLRGVLAAPDHLEWQASGAVRHAPTGQPVDAIIRFFPAEWLPELGHPRRWRGLFGPQVAAPSDQPAVLLTNPATAVLVQSKRWPLLWDQLATPLPAWRSTLPETRDPRRIRHETGAAAADWVLKPAMGRVGEGVLIPGIASRDERALRRDARRDPGSWVAQRRFHSIPLDSPIGPLHICLGVYVVDGRAAGLYARASSRALIDQGAYELPVLIDHTASNPSTNWSPYDRA